MPRPDSSEAIFSLAIEREERAASFYALWAKMATVPETKKLLHDLCHDEKFHKEKLVMVRRGKLTMHPNALQAVSEITAKDTSPQPPRSEADYCETLKWAMAKEKYACQLYLKLADSLDDQNLKETLLAMGSEEEKHYLKLKMEFTRASRSETVRKQFKSE
jgi:rubrerythrin